MGQAIRILTGASLPTGVDTVIMQEDVQVAGGMLRFESGLKAGANCRAMGEDVVAGAVALSGATRLGPQEVGLLAALGVAEVSVYKCLRVGVVSTGDELRQPGEEASAHQIYDANRPMLLALLRDWGFDAVDLGVAADDRAAVSAMLDKAAESCDALLTSGGASAGGEDHMSAVLGAEGRLNLWRIAIKSGRPLALAMWQGMPVFGLLGNPVAAFTTALIFACPALGAHCKGRGGSNRSPRFCLRLLSSAKRPEGASICGRGAKVMAGLRCLLPKALAAYQDWLGLAGLWSFLTKFLRCRRVILCAISRFRIYAEFGACQCFYRFK